MAITLPDARQPSDEVPQALRLPALRGIELGLMEARVGIEALPQPRSGRPLGSGRFLSEAQARHIRNLLDQNSPEDLGIAAALWSRSAVRDLIRRELNFELVLRTVGEYLQRWGYTARVPCRHAWDQDREVVRQWLEETYPAIEKRAAEEGAEIFWCDETGMAADEHPAVGNSRQGQPAPMEVAGPHLRMNQVSAISNEGKVRFMTYAKAMSAALFIDFLGRLLHSTTGKIFLILERRKAHEKEEVEDWVADHQDRLELFWLPRRAPDRDPEESLNPDVRPCVHAAGLPDNRGGYWT
jgi:transposase